MPVFIELLPSPLATSSLLLVHYTVNLQLLHSLSPQFTISAASLPLIYTTTSHSITLFHQLLPSIIRQRLPSYSHLRAHHPYCPHRHSLPLTVTVLSILITSFHLIAFRPSLLSFPQLCFPTFSFTAPSSISRYFHVLCSFLATKLFPFPPFPSSPYCHSSCGYSFHSCRPLLPGL